MNLLKSLEKYTLKKQMVILIFSTYASYLLLMLIICLSVLFATNNTVKNDSEEALFTQSEINVGKISNGTLYWFTEKLESGERGFLNIYSYAMGDTYRSDYTLSNNTPSYFEYGDTYLAQPLVNDSRQTKLVSLVDSGYYIPGSTPGDISNFSTTINQTRSQTAHIDSYLGPLYRQYTDFVAGYIGFSDTGLFEHYPGIGTLDTDPNRNYDPRVRGWYTKAIENNGETVITSPYQDFNGKGWMITIARRLSNVETGEIVGVAGADMLIREINENLKAITILDSGKVTLFEDTGIVVSDKEWEGDPLDNLGKKYSDLANPVISDDLWNELVSASSGSVIEKTIDDLDYIITVTRPTRFIFQKYLLVTWILKDEVSAPIDNIVEEMSDFNTAVTTGLTLAFLAFIIISIFIVILISNKITKPLEDIDHSIDRIIKKIGTQSDLFNKSTADFNKAFSDEQRNLNNQMNQFYHQNQQMREESKNANEGPNEYFAGQNPIIYSPYDNNQQFPAGSMMPSAPDQSDFS